MARHIDQDRSNGPIGQHSHCARIARHTSPTWPESRCHFERGHISQIDDVHGLGEAAHHWCFLL